MHVIWALWTVVQFPVKTLWDPEIKCRPFEEISKSAFCSDFRSESNAAVPVLVKRLRGFLECVA